MQRFTAIFIVLLAGSFAYAQHHHNPQPSSASQPSTQALSGASKDNAQSSEYSADPVTVTGYLRDTECLLKNPKAREANTDETRACLRACVRGGAPLGVLTHEGELYTLLGQETPDANLRSKLEPFAGHNVRVTGWKVVRGGSQAMVIKSINLEK